MAEISKTADQALAVLLELSERGPATPAEVARNLNLNRTVVHRLLSTLHRRGFIIRQQDGYVPGAILVRIANGIQPALRSQGRAVMLDLVESVGETLVMHIPDGDDAVVLEQVVAEDNVVRVEHRIGSRHRLVMGASGRAILAFMPGVADRIVRKEANGEALQRQLDSVRQVGYALSHDELQQGVHGLAVPVLSGNQTAVASLAVLVPTTRASGLAQHIDVLVEGAARLAANIDGSVQSNGTSGS
jgi:IclR family transcriptional regulator, KDG regulon repressor